MPNLSLMTSQFVTKECIIMAYKGILTSYEKNVIDVTTTNDKGLKIKEKHYIKFYWLKKNY